MRSKILFDNAATLLKKQAAAKKWQRDGRGRLISCLPRKRDFIVQSPAPHGSVQCRSSTLREQLYQNALRQERKMLFCHEPIPIEYMQDFANWYIGNLPNKHPEMYYVPGVIVLARSEEPEQYPSDYTYFYRLWNMLEPTETRKSRLPNRQGGTVMIVLVDGHYAVWFFSAVYALYFSQL